MRPPKPRSLVVFFVGLGVPAVAAAQLLPDLPLTPSPARPASAAPPARFPPRRFDFAIERGLTGSASRVAAPKSETDPAWQPGFGFGLAATARLLFIRLGVALDATTQIGPSAFHAGGLLGTTFRPVPALRLDLLGEVGVAHYRDIGSGLLTRVLGDHTATLPFAGVRLGVAWRFGARRHGYLGADFVFREDIGRRDISPEVDPFCILGPCSNYVVDYRVGGETLTLFTRIGVEM